MNRKRVLLITLWVAYGVLAVIALELTQSAACPAAAFCRD